MLGQDVLGTSQWSDLLDKISSERNIPKPLAKIFSPRPACIFLFPGTFFLCLVTIRISERRHFMVRIWFLSHCGWQPCSTKLKPVNYWSRLNSPLGTSEVTGNQLDPHAELKPHYGNSWYLWKQLQHFHALKGWWKTNCSGEMRPFQNMK